MENHKLHTLGRSMPQAQCLENNVSGSCTCIDIYTEVFSEGHAAMPVDCAPDSHDSIRSRALNKLLNQS